MRATMPACVLVLSVGHQASLLLTTPPFICSASAPRPFPGLLIFFLSLWPGLSSPPLQGQPFTDSTGHWLIISVFSWRLMWFVLEVGVSWLLRQQGLNLEDYNPVVLRNLSRLGSHFRDPCGVVLHWCGHNAVVQACTAPAQARRLGTTDLGFPCPLLLSHVVPLYGHSCRTGVISSLRTEGMLIVVLLVPDHVMIHHQPPVFRPKTPKASRDAAGHSQFDHLGISRKGKKHWKPRC